MSVVYRLHTKKQLSIKDPLHVEHFYGGKLRVRRKSLEDRQQLIFYLAKLHAEASRKPKGFAGVKVSLTSLRNWVYDYRCALDHFFDVQQLGFNVLDEAKLSTLIPKSLVCNVEEVKKLKLEYLPGPRPEGTMSKVYIQQQNAAQILSRLESCDRLDLKEPVEWLLKQVEVNFIFQRCGKLKQRDTSVWPVAAVETWPSWLREQLFGPGIDIESAYTQYLVGKLRAAYADNPANVKRFYPDLVKAIDDKNEWRRELCVEVLGLEHTDENLSVVKSICMSLANGSRISAAILQGSSRFSSTANLIKTACSGASEERLKQVGKRLDFIAKQYIDAKKAVCNHALKMNPTRKNQKLVFINYFTWERDARYLLWEAVDRHGIMVHDGIDGIPERYMTDLPALIEKTGLKVSL